MRSFLGILLICSGQLVAQPPVTLHFINDDTHRSIPGITLRLSRSERERGKSFVADSTGIVHLPDLLPGKYVLQCTGVGYRSKETILTLPAAADTLTLSLEPDIEALQNVVISSTRTNQLLKNSPITVQVIDREDIDEGTAQSPANIRELLTELSGTQVQTTSAVSGNVSIRLQGLDGRYTQVLKDGFPLYGGFSGSLSILQVPPLDLRQVEVIKGAGSALYGGDAIAGIINLISRKPDTGLRLDAIVNQTDKGGTDLGVFAGRRGKRVGFTVMATASHQNPADINKDGFTDLPKVRQGTLAPTLFWYPGDSTTLRLGINVSTEDRTGGDLQAVEHGADSLHPFLQFNHTDRDYYQLTFTHKARHRQTLELKNSVGYFYRSIGQPLGGFAGAEISSYTEANYSIGAGDHTFVTGLDLNTDRFHPARINANLGYDHVTAGLFAQDDWNILSYFTLEAGARADIEHSLYFLPRMALLYKPARALTVRLGGGLAYKLPTVFNATDEEDAYQQVYPIAPGVVAERSASVNLALGYHGRIGDDMDLSADENLYYTRLEHALFPATDSLARGWLYYINAPGLVTSYGSETNLRLRMTDFTFQLGYTCTEARRLYESGHPPLPLTPRNRISASLVYEAEPSWKAGVESFYTSGQVLDNGQQVRDFWTFDVMVQRNWGPWGLSVNIENLTDTRQSKFGPLYTGTKQSPVFNEVYAPIEGRIISFALRYAK